VAAVDDGSVVDADAPIIKLVNTVIVEAFKMRASDIHLEPLGKKFRLRYRIDGVLHEMKSPPKRLQPSIISRLKIMSNMSISERRIPQDGRIQIHVGGRRSTCASPACRRTMARASSCVSWTRKA
jgi:type IV pilus assembly protein PilB